MALTLDQRQIIDMINQLPDNVKKDTIEIISHMHDAVDTTKNDLTDNIVGNKDRYREEQEIAGKEKVYFSIPSNN